MIGALRGMINRDAWLTALNEVCAVDNDPASLTMRDFAALLGIQIGAAKLRMARLVRAGKATKTVKHVCRSDGQVIVVPAYRLVTGGAHDQTPDA